MVIDDGLLKKLSKIGLDTARSVSRARTLRLINVPDLEEENRLDWLES